MVFFLWSHALILTGTPVHGVLKYFGSLYSKWTPIHGIRFLISCLWTLSSGISSLDSVQWPLVSSFLRGISGGLHSIGIFLVPGLLRVDIRSPVLLSPAPRFVPGLLVTSLVYYTLTVHLHGILFLYL